MQSKPGSRQGLGDVRFNLGSNGAKPFVQTPETANLSRMFSA